MNAADTINALFELAGSFFILLSILKLEREKQVRGVSWLHTGFFTAWGLWNLWFYPAVGAWLSFIGGIALVLTNAYWLGQIIYYTQKEKRNVRV